MGLDTHPKHPWGWSCYLHTAPEDNPLCPGTSPYQGHRGEEPFAPQTVHQTLLYTAFAVSVPSELPAVPSSAFPISQTSMKISGLVTNEARLPQKNVQASMEIRGCLCA